ncbi:hypothetical protein V4C85_22290 [Ralstonia solanacearum]|uniref:hypothetical protein n=1 Tax=Ralstonia solanacearum TaxID=305 RepID=UPI001FF91082
MKTTSEQSRSPRAGICVGIAMLCATAPVLAEGAFRHLGAAEIKKAIVGKAVTDGAHWSDRFKPDGTVESIMHGQVQNGRWHVRGSELCMACPTGKTTAEECFEVWRRDHVLEYRRNGTVIAQGELVNR